VSAASPETAPPIPRSPAHPGPATLRALAGTEIRRAARNVALWLGAAAYLGLAGSRWVPGEEPRQAWASENYLVWDWPAAFLYMAAFLVANYVALRERPSTTAELFVNTPAGRWERTAALLAAAVVPAMLGLLAQLGYLALILRAGGITVGDEPYTVSWQPTPVEVLAVPMAAALAWVAGVAMARTMRSRAVGAVVGIVGAYLIAGVWLWYWLPGFFVAIIRTSLVVHDLGPEPAAEELARWPAVDLPDRAGLAAQGIDRDVPLFVGHFAFLVALFVALSGWALVRSGSDRRGRWLLAVGGAAVIVAIGGQSLILDAPSDFGELP
jgi:hypothetical protein